MLTRVLDDDYLAFECALSHRTLTLLVTGRLSKQPSTALVQSRTYHMFVAHRLNPSGLLGEF